jgi:phosphate transport system permease protein
LESTRQDLHFNDLLFSYFLKSISWLLPVLLIAVGLFLFGLALPTIHRFGFHFIETSVWDPVHESFGALPVIYGTLVSSFMAIIIAAPVSIGVALFLTDLAPKRASRIIGFLVEMLAAIPSVVYGLWGIFILAPWLRSSIEPILGRKLGWLPIFSGPPYGVGMLAAGIILAIMIIPTISSICREVFRAIPRSQREAALAIGATKWEVMSISVIKSAKSGIFGAVVLGLGRALGETMAVTMVIGNRAAISASFFAPSQTMASVIANEYAEATSNAHLSALMAIGLTLFVLTFGINSVARLIIWRTSTLGQS